MTPATTISAPVQSFVPGQISDAAVRAVEKIHQECLRGIEADLAGLLQQPAAIRLREIRQALTSSAIAARGSDAHVAALDLRPVQARGYLVFPAALLFRMLDILLASPGLAEGAEENPEEPAPEAGRMVTGIELHILRECFDVFSNALRKAWEPIYPLAFELLPEPDKGAAESEGAMDEPALVLSFSLDLAGASADLDVVMPAFVARFVELNAKPRSGRETPEPVRSGILETLGKARVRFDVVLNGAGLCVADLLQLAPGHVISLGLPESQTVDCRINGKRQFAAELVVSGARRGVQIVRAPDVDK